METKTKKDEPLIKLVNVSKIYSMGEVDVVALKDVSLEIYENEFVAIIGASGSGKSTMMNLVGCLDTPSEGSVYLESYNISELSPSDLSTLRGKSVGLVFQQYNLIPSMNAFGNVKLSLELQEVPDKEADERVMEILRLLKMDERKNNFPSQLSGGQQQRISIARCLAADPKVILADEPTGALDSVTGKGVIDILRKLWKDDKKTVVMITHDLNLAKYASRIVELKDGMIIKDYHNGHTIIKEEV